MEPVDSGKPLEPSVRDTENGGSTALTLMSETLRAGLEMDPKTREAKQKRLALLEQYFTSLDGYKISNMDALVPVNLLPAPMDMDQRRKHLERLVSAKKDEKLKERGGFRKRMILEAAEDTDFKGPKLVRDKIIDMKRASKEVFTYRQIPEGARQEFFEALLEKLVEETRELVFAQEGTKMVDEMADIAEVSKVLLEVSGVSMEQIKHMQQSKAATQK